MGLLDQILGGGKPQTGGTTGSSGPSPLTLALLAVLAYQTFKGKGRLADMLGHSAPDAAPADGQQPQSAGDATSSGGLGDLLKGGLGGILGGAAGGGGGGLGGLGGLLAGAGAGGLLSGGLADLMRHFQDNGHGETVQSWVGQGENKSISPSALENILGPGTLDELQQHTGMDRASLLSGLSAELPAAINQLTPDGRLPTEAEASRMV
jgi:uncharacterized protein YidB (DUF937 family)